jgi:Uncharacterised protein conserved in bacteria (DUF2336)
VWQVDARFTFASARIASVAMPSSPAQNSLLLDLEKAIQSRDAKERAVVLDRVTALFLVGTRNNEQVELFDDVFSQLVQQVEATARARLSGHLAHLATAPYRVIQSLAEDDDIDVAGPVLAHSSQVSDDNLIRIAQTKGQAHLLSIAGRTQVVEAVSDVLVDRGSNEVLQRLSGNASARFSETGLTRLATRAASDETIAGNMANRSDVPPRVFRHLLTQATKTVRNSLLSGANPEQHALILHAMDEISDELAQPRGQEITAEVRRGVYEAFEKGQLKESTVLEFARANMTAEVIVSLAVMTSTAIEIVEHQMLSGRMSGVLLLCKSKDFNWPTAKTILSAARARTESELEQARQEYYALTVQTAARALRFVGAKQALTQGASEIDIGSPLMKPAMRPLLN